MMSVEIFRRGSGTAFVTTGPHWLLRMLRLGSTRERVAIRLHNISGGVRWVYEFSGRVVEPSVLAAIVAAERELEWAALQLPRRPGLAPPS